MCHYHRARYNCEHFSFTKLARTCYVQNQHLANPEACPPCNVKVPHPLCTVCVQTKCIKCQNLDRKMLKISSELGSLKKRVEKLETNYSTKRLAERAQKALEGNPHLRREKMKELGEAASVAKERLKKCVKEAREMDFCGHGGWESDGSEAGGVLLNVISEAGEVFGEALSS